MIVAWRECIGDLDNIRLEIMGICQNCFDNKRMIQKILLIYIFYMTKIFSSIAASQIKRKGCCSRIISKDSISST